MALPNKEKINRALRSKIVDARVAQVFNTFDRVLFTSSFGTTSAVLLHILSRVKPGHPVYFVDTGHLFKETFRYKEQLSSLLGLNVITLKPDPSRQMSMEVQQMWRKDPDTCCRINKVEPLQKVKKRHRVWVSGLIGYQSGYRNTLSILQDDTGILKFYPLIDWDRSLVEEYLETHSLPSHPLHLKGYDSVGCTHCTKPGQGRDGRWSGSGKSECGLHH